MGMLELMRSGGAKREVIPVDVVPFNYRGICEAAEQLKQNREEIGGDYFYTVKVPSGEGSSFTVVPPGDGKKESVDTFSGVVVYSQKYRARYKDGAPLGSSPVCYAPLGTFGKAVESEEEMDCSECPFARIGTDSKGIGAACKDRIELRIMHEGLCAPIVFRLPRQSAEVWRGYANRLRIEHGLQPYQVITEFSLTEAVSSQGIKYSKISLRTVGRLDPENEKISREFAGTFRPYLLLEASRSEEITNND